MDYSSVLNKKNILITGGTGSFGQIGNVNGLVNITSSKDEIVLDSGSNISWAYRLGSLKGLDFDGTLYGSKHSGSMVVGTPPKFFYEATCSVAQDSTLKRGVQKTILNWKPRWDSKSAVEHTIKWYSNFYKNTPANQLIVDDLKKYISRKTIKSF